MVFTTQGACEPHAEALLSQIAGAIATTEESDAAVVKADMLQAISLCIARSVARSVFRRSNRKGSWAESRSARLHAELEILREADDNGE